MKSVTALKCKDGWMVTVSDVRTISNDNEVRKFIKQQGLEVTVSTPIKIVAH